MELIEALPPVADQLRAAVDRAVSAERWAFGHSSNGDGSAPFWKMDLRGVSAVDELWRTLSPKCEQLVGKELRVLRQYANGHTFGLGGRTHIDDSAAGRFTLLFYPMREWLPEWHGETIFRPSRGLVAVAPAPGVAVLFDSRIPHEGRAPARCFSGLRVTVAFKLRVA